MVAVRVDEQSVRKLAGPAYFERGARYFAAGQVRRIAVDGTRVTATVDGTRTYRVRLDVTATGLRGDCSCPVGDEGAFCKHCVAAALAWLDHGGQVGKPRPKPLSDKRLRSFLLGCDQSWLVDQLMAAAKRDRVLRARLASEAGDGSAFDDSAHRERLEQAIEIAEFVDYAGAYSYFHHVGEALEEVAALVDNGFPDAAITLAAYALDLLDDAADRVDDSDGGLHEAIARAEEIHLAACAAGSPDPVALAEQLFSRATSSDHEVFLDAVPDYQDVLGAAGMARFRELVETAWTALPSVRRDDYSTTRFAITHLMEALAETTGGADALLDVLTRDIASGHDILRVAERLRLDGRDDEALAWIERGLADYEPDPRLRTLAADIHHRAGRPEQAGDLLLANFADHPTLDAYRALIDAVGPIPWRERALALLAGQPPAQGPWSPGRSTLVEILLHDGDPDAAWRAATDGGCSDALWLRLARIRATTHPQDAVPVLLRAAEQAIEHRNRDSYADAARLLLEARQLADDHAFREHLAALRHTHRTKWALRQELDSVGLS